MKKSLKNKIDDDLHNLLSNEKTEVIFTDPKLDIPIYKPKVKNKHILVLNGGGVKGIAHIGALKALEEYGYLEHITVLAGASVGALIISMFIIGYQPDEMWEFIKMFDLNNMKHISIRDRSKYYTKRVI